MPSHSWKMPRYFLGSFIKLLNTSESIISVDWFLTGHGIPLLAVATSRNVSVFCSNLPKDPLASGRWTKIYSKDQNQNDEFTLIKWLANGKLFVACTKKNIIIEKFFRRGLLKTSDVPTDTGALEESLFELASHLDGALPSFHPILLKEYLIWSKIV